MEPPARHAQDLSSQPPHADRADSNPVSPTSRLRIVAYAAVLTAITFTQAPGRIVADTKFDLSADPWAFMMRALHMWDAQGAFGQVQNQAIGYLWPMGPFYALGQLAHLPEWVIQRLWWALLLNLAFFGVLTLARALRLGRPWAQVAGAAAYVLTPRVMTILGANSVELWPTAVAPWVLLAVIRASGTTTTKDLVRWCALAALAVACAGGVNATAVSAVLVPGVVFLLTRTGVRRFVVLGLWGLLTVLATLWWTVPLVLQGRYIPPFLDYIETAAVTASTTGLLPTLLGTSDWVAYADPIYYPAGQSLHTTAYLVLDAAAVVAIGLAGLAGLGRARRHPESRFLIGCVLTGALLVGIGYTGALAGWGAEARQDLVDGALAAVRNSHKYDAVLRLGLAAGVVLTVETILIRSGLARAAAAAEGSSAGARTAEWLRKVFVVAVVASLAGLAVPWVRGQVPPPGAIENVPGFWTDAADYLSETDDGGVTLVVPAARFGDYLWGSTHDEVLQPYADSRWAVRGVVPLAEPGNVVWLDRVTEELERGTSSADLAPMLAKAGVTRLLVRNDLHWGTTGAPPPSLAHATLDRSPGLRREKTFGSEFGNSTYHRENGTRVLVDGGLAGEYAPIEIYDVEHAEPGASLIPARTTVMGDPGEPASGASAVLTADDTRAADSGPEEKADVILTDGQRRRTTIFSGVRANSSSTRTAEEGVDSDKPESFHRYLEDQERWQSTMVWRGVEAVEASSSAATAAEVPVDRGHAPAAAFDGDPATSWRTETGWGRSPEGAWLRVRFEQETDLGKVTVAMPPGVVGVKRLELVAGAQMRKVYAPQPGEEATYDLTGFSARNLTVTARGITGEGPWGISELDIEGVEPQRLVALPEPPADSAIRKIRLSRDADRSGCITTEQGASARSADHDGVVYCEPLLASAGDDGDDLDRLVTLTRGQSFSITGKASLRRGAAHTESAGALAGVDIEAPSRGDIAQSALAMVDDDPGTSWRAPSTGEASVSLRLADKQPIRTLRLKVAEAAPVSIPTEVEITDPHRPKRTITREVAEDGEVELPEGWRTDRLAIRITEADTAYDQPSSQASASELPVGISELQINDEPLSDGRLRASCADGPRIQVGDRSLRTAVHASLSDLLRGAEVPLEVCDSAPVELSVGENTLLADADTDDPLRVDSLELSADAIAPAEAPEPVAVERDERDAAVSADVSATSYDRVLVLPQNINAGATATLDGKRLRSQRVDGWQQGWIVPAGAGGEVRLGFAPDGPYRLGLLAGAAGVVLVVALALVTSWRRRSATPGLEVFPVAAPWRWFDAGVLVVVAGLLAGWWGALAAVVAWALPRLLGRTPGVVRLLAAGSGAALLAGALVVEVVPAVWDLPWDPPAWAAQALSLAAVVLAAAAASAGPRERAAGGNPVEARLRNGVHPRSRITGRSKKR